MRNKTLNIIGIAAVIIAFATAFFITGENKMTELGKFNLNALENAETRVSDSIKLAREQVEELVKIENKTYMNFVRPLMDIDVSLKEVIASIYHLNMVNGTDESQKIIEDITPIISDYSSDMARHTGVYKGMQEIKEKEYDSLNTAQRRVIDDSIKSFEISGIALPAEQQARLKEIESLSAKLGQQFSKNITDANKLNKIKITDEEILGDMPQSDKNSARVEDGWEFSLLIPSYIPFMEYVTDRNLREQMYKNYVTRAPQNAEIIPELLKFRIEQAKILGFKNYAELALQFRDAKKPENVARYSDNIVNTVKPVAQREYDELKAFSKIDLQPWDSVFYSRLLKLEKYNLDEAETKPYFTEKNVVDGALAIYSEMFDIQFKERNANKWFDTVRYFDIIQDGKVVAGLYMDLQTRESKRPGAWMEDLKLHHRDANDVEHLSEVVIVGNFPPAVGNTPSLLSLSDISTFFHEMGHALHGLLSKVDEESIAGTEVYRDVVEFPSQFLESFWNNPTVLKRIGKHYQTGETIPDNLIERIITADRFQKSTFIIRQLELGIFDMQLHLVTENIDINTAQSVLDSVRKRVSINIPPSYNKFQHTFNHIFGGDFGYAAGYYSYIWAESMAADAYLAFDGNPFNKELARKYRDIILGMGGTKDMSELYIDFLGHEPKPESLLKFYGLK